MIRLRNPEVSRIELMVERLNRVLGWTEPLPMYRPGFGARHFAFEDFADSMRLILKGIEVGQQLTGADSKTMCDDEQSVEPDSLPGVLDVVDR